MPYDNTVTTDYIKNLETAYQKVDSYHRRIRKTIANLQIIQDIIIPEIRRQQLKINADGAPALDENGKEIIETVVIPTKIIIPQDERAFKEFTVVKRIEIQTDAKTEADKILAETDKLT